MLTANKCLGSIIYPKSPGFLSNEALALHTVAFEVQNWAKATIPTIEVSAKSLTRRSRDPCLKRGDMVKNGERWGEI